jgi:hypothetical protein
MRVKWEITDKYGQGECTKTPQEVADFFGKPIAKSGASWEVFSHTPSINTETLNVYKKVAQCWNGHVLCIVPSEINIIYEGAWEDSLTLPKDW